MSPPGGNSRATSVPLHISRAGSPVIRSATTVYAVSMGDGVGTSLLGAPGGVDALNALLEKIGVARSEIEAAGRGLAVRPYHKIRNVKLPPKARRQLDR